VILVDANLLLYAANRAAPEHERTRAWLDERLNGNVRVGLPWPSLLAFARIVTNPAIVRHPVEPLAAWQQIRQWLDCDVVWIPLPTERHAEVLEDLVALPGLTSRLIPDAHLAALAIEHGLRLCSTDGDFARFPGLKWENPLAASHP
jgi:toxin-antitoxin system PIN domain toxin